MLFNIDELKASVSLVALFERDGHVLKKRGADTWRCKCPFHEERTASCHVHEKQGFFKCFGCGAGGTIVEYWALSRGLDRNGDFRAICEELQKLGNGAAIASLPRRPERKAEKAELPPPLSGKDLEKWKEGCSFLAANPAEQETLAVWRGVRRETIGAFAALGMMGLPRYFGKRLPAFGVEAIGADGVRYMAGFHVRLEPAPGERPAWHFAPKGIGAWPFVIGDPKTCKAMVILEGEWDPLAFVDALNNGIPAKHLAVVGVRGNYSWQMALKLAWDEAQTQVWMIADSDEAGMTWLEKEDGFAAHVRRRCRALHAMCWEGVKDFNDAHREACKADGREAWTKGLREMLRRQWANGLRRRPYRPLRQLNSNS